MEKKEIAKRYLIFATLLLAAFFIISFALFIALSENGSVNISLTVSQSALAALCCAVVPTGGYTGILHFGLKIKEFSNTQAVLFVIFLPLILAFVIISGIILIIPEYIISVKTLRG